MKIGYLNFDEKEELYVITFEDGSVQECYCGMPIEVFIDGSWMESAIKYDADENVWFLDGVNAPEPMQVRLTG